MTRNRTLAITVFASILLRAATAAAQDTPAPSAQPTKPMPNAYRGMFVCEQVPGGADVLHVPIDMIIRGDNVLFARPLFNLRGTRVLGSELGVGTMDGDGKVRLTSAWRFRGIVVHGAYNGTLTPSGGTLSGMQMWRTAAGPGSRTCEIALVPVPNADQQQGSSEQGTPQQGTAPQGTPQQ